MGSNRTYIAKLKDLDLASCNEKYGPAYRSRNGMHIYYEHWTFWTKDLIWITMKLKPREAFDIRIQSACPDCGVPAGTGSVDAWGTKPYRRKCNDCGVTLPVEMFYAPTRWRWHG